MSDEVAPRTQGSVEMRHDTLLQTGVVVSRDTIEHAVKMIALSCCRGERQVALIEELLDTGLITKNLKPVPGFNWKRGNGMVVAWGSVGIGGDSFKNLKARMMKAGFTFNMIANAYNDGQLQLGYMRVYWGVQEGQTIIE